MARTARGNRRPTGWLRQHVLDLLTAAACPLSAGRLVAALHQRDRGVHASAIFRALHELIAAGAIEKVELAAAYVARRPPRALAAVCSRCGQYATIPDGAPLDDLANLARSHGFSPRRFIVEVGGRCRDCVGAGPTR